jgi:hypothetical protein
MLHYTPCYADDGHSIAAVMGFAGTMRQGWSWLSEMEGDCESMLSHLIVRLRLILE